MSTAESSSEPLYARRTAAQLRQDRRRGIAAWREAVTLSEQQPAGRESREASTEARRRLEALQLTNATLERRAEGVALADTGTVRAVVVHRLEWMRERLAAGLSDHGIAVIGSEQDGAVALGITIAEQPDLLVVEDRLPSVPAVELVRSLKLFAPSTLAAAQVEHPDAGEALIEAGAAAVFSRRIPPQDVCAQLALCLRERPGDPLIVG